ncbi:hypothetical protein M3629_16080 [Paenibacillus polysaccharolyticus]|uniref:hypothetical protein n=1 Tax=Paenibacillus polysaccharolyticus TaxID=582692 RepID=UPI0020405707|nr:hypothetical protein [Paenibacillus polysaccharolyticus]MCM3134313.1 hypothetical protein [Paenibacillus polysaccharolyticus]
MQLNKSVYIMLLIAVALGFTLGWYLDSISERETWEPDQMNLYRAEEQKSINKKENPQLFDQLLSLIVFEKGDMISGGNAPLSEDEVNDIKKSGAIEYVYNEPITIQMNNGNDSAEKVEFTSILFPVDDKWNGACYIQTTDSKYLYFESRPSLSFILRHM